MGWTFALVLLRSPDPRHGGDGVLRVMSDTGGPWSVYSAPQETRPSALEAMMVRLAVDEDAPALCAYAEDSDWAYVSAATPDGVAARILVEPEGAEDYEEGQDALSLTAQQTADPFEAMAVWSSFAPRPASADALRAIGTGQYVLREEAVMAFFTAMGIDVPWDRL